ncbi:autotransporter domain-containing protein [Phyllobacterium ifriqiyense]|uniref:autotransporter domain-containing protein n=1 Tax=Phyllobacterium ifriqiyense TaxID=314238 RepID=UPI0033907DDC
MSILRKFNRVSTLAIVAAALCITQAKAEEFVNKPFPFKRMVTFGDSLSDIGALKPPLDLIRQNQQKITQTLRDISGLIESPPADTPDFDWWKSHEYSNALRAFSEPPYSVPRQTLATLGKSLSSETKKAIVATLKDVENKIKGMAEYGANMPFGRFSNGPVWNQYLAGDQVQATSYPDNVDKLISRALIEAVYQQDDVGLKYLLSTVAQATGHLWEYPAQPASDSSSMNYAVGGARVGRKGDDLISTLLIPGLLDQLEELDYAHIEKDTLIVSWFGGNDLFALSKLLASGADPAPLVKEVKDNLEQGLETLYSANGRIFLLPNVPDASLTPEFKNNGDTARALTKVISDTIASVAANFEAKHSGEVTIYKPDMLKLMGVVTRYPSAFGFSNTTDKCIDDETCRLNPTPLETGYLFWDGVHATTRAHGYIANYFATHWQHPDLAGSYFSSPEGFYDTRRHYFFPTNDLTFDDQLNGNNALYKLNDATLTLTDANNYTGGTFIEGGKLQLGNGGLSGSIVGDVAVSKGAELGFNRSNSYTFAGSISGEGTVVQLGTGVTILTGNSTYTGPTTISHGGLSVTGSLISDVTAQGNTFIDGNGSVGSLHAERGSKIAPGTRDRIGDLRIARDATIEKEALLDIEIADDLSSADRIDIGGKAMLRGGHVQLRMLGHPELLTSEQVDQLFLKQYEILHADGGVEGQFEAVSPQFNFISPSLIQDAKSVNVHFDPTKSVLDRMLAMEDPIYASSSNHRSVWGGFKSFGTKSPLFNTVLFSTKDRPLDYDTLTGEVHASLSNTLVQNNQMIGDAAASRIRSAFDGIAAKGQSAQSVGVAPLAYGPDRTKIPEAFALTEPEATTQLWGQGYGFWARLDGNGNASGVSSKTGGLVTGFDGIIEDDFLSAQWRAGLLGGYGSSSVNNTYGKADIDSYQMGVYGGANWDALGLRFGVNLAHHEIETEREVHFGNINGDHHADYGANSVQVFGELGYEFKPAQGLVVEPFAGIRHASVKTEAFEESGAVSQLAALANRTDSTSSTLGLRASYQMVFSGDISAMLRGTIGWNHGFGDLTPQQRLSFAGASPFTVEGLPTARDAAFIEAGMDFNVSQRTTLGVTYTGQFSQSGHANGVNADIAVRF